jgi:tape measure domain-containing protein
MADSLKTYKIELNVDTAKGVAEVSQLIKTLNDTGVPIDKITKSIDKFGKASISVLTQAVTEAQAATLGFSHLSTTLSGLSKLTIGDNITGKLKQEQKAYEKFWADYNKLRKLAMEQEIRDQKALGEDIARDYKHREALAAAHAKALKEALARQLAAERQLRKEQEVLGRSQAKDIDYNSAMAKAHAQAIRENQKRLDAIANDTLRAQQALGAEIARDYKYRELLDREHTRALTENTKRQVAAQKAANAQMLADAHAMNSRFDTLAREATARAREQETQRLSQFSTFLREREALLRADINHQRQVEISGINSIEAFRADAQRKRIAAEQAYRNRIAIIESSVRGGTSSSTGQTQATAAMQHYLQVLKQVDAQLATHENALRHTEAAHHSLWLRVAAVSTIYNIWSTSIHRAYQALMSVPTTGIHLEGTRASLLAITKSTAGVSNEMTFLRQEAHRTGLSLDGLRGSFRLFAASAITSGESIQTVENIFKNVNTMATTLHMSEDDINGVFLAFSQIFNKGKLQAEELVKQLAQRIPGSVTMMAKAYGKAGESIQASTQRLLKDMKSGSVAAHENIAKFAEVLGSEFGGEAFKHASTGLNAELGKLSTSWTELTENIYKGSGRSIGNLVGMGRSWVEMARDATSNTFELNQTFTQIGLTVSMFTKAMGGLAATALVLYIAKVVQAGEVTLVLTTLIKANPYILAASALLALTTAMTQYGEASRRAGEAEKERLELTRQLAEERVIKAPEVKEEEDRLKRVKDSDSLKPFKDRYDTDAKEFYRLREEYNKLKADMASNKATPLGTAKPSGKSDAMLQAALDDLKPRLEVARVNAFNSARKVNEKFKTEYEAIKAQETLAGTGINEASVLEETAYDISSRRNAKLTKEIEDRIGVLEKEKRAALDELKIRMDIQKLRSGKTGDPVEENNKARAISKKYDAQIKALIGEKSNLIESGERKTLEGAGKSITAFDKLVQIMRTMESRGRIDAVSPVGAVGKHQVMPSTLAHGNYGDRVQGIPEAELQQAIAYEQVGRRTRKMSPQMYSYLRNFATKYSDKIADFGVNELRKNFEHFGHDASKALAAYNAGRGTIEKLSRSRGESWISGLPAETRNYVREGIRLGAPKAAGELDKYEGQRSSIAAQAQEQAITARKEALDAEQIAAQREKALRLEREKAAEQLIKNNLATEELQIETDSYTQNQLAADLAKITYEHNKKEAELKKEGNFAGIEVLKIKTAQARVQATLAEAERKVSKDTEFAAMAEADLNVKKTTGIITEKRYQEELAKIKEAQIPNLEEELRLTESIVKEEDRRLAVAKIQSQIAELRRDSAQSLDMKSVGKEFLENAGSSADSTDSRGYRERKTGLLVGKSEELSAITPVGMDDKEGQLQSQETFLQQKNALDQKYADANFINQSNYYSGLASVGANTFQGITGHMITMYGAQSKQAKIAFVAYKAFMVAQTIMNTASAVVAQLTNPTPYVGVALAAMAAATGAIQVAKIIAEPMPQAHGGLEYVPEDATYKLSKGERVLAPKQNEAFMRLNNDLSAQMQRDSAKTGKPKAAAAPTVVKPQIKVVNIDYSSQEIENHLKSSAGEEIVINHMRRNQETLA